MIFFDLVVYTILGISVSFMWSFSDIFRPVRNFVARIPYINKPLICPECSSFWMGLLVSFFYNPLLPLVGLSSYLFLGLVVHLFACLYYKIYIKLS